MASSVTAPLERQFGQVPGLSQMTSTSSLRQLGHHAAIQSQPEHRRRRAGGAGRHQCRHDLSAARPAQPADLQQGESGRRADPDAGADFGHAAAVARWKTWPTRRWRRRSRSCPASAWSRISGGQKPAVRIQANPTALASYGLSLEDLRTALAAGQRQPGQGQLRRPAPVLHHRRQRSAAARARNTAASIIAYKNGAPVRLSDVANVDRRRRERQAGRLDEHHSGGDRQHPAPARRQHHQRGRPRQAAAAAVAGVAARRRSRCRCSPTAPRPFARR